MSVHQLLILHNYRYYETQIVIYNNNKVYNNQNNITIDATCID